LKTKRIVISGGPGSGKTTLINHLEKEGYPCLHEISRAVTRKAQQEGIEQLFLENPILFSQKLLEGRLEQFEKAEVMSDAFLFYDRGMPDVTAYMDYLAIHYPDHFSETIKANRYDLIFLLPPWKSIYQQDEIRYESFDQAVTLYNYLRKGYQKYDYTVIEVPTANVKDRAHYILEHLKNLF
jgi:predicted ATPase